MNSIIEEIHRELDALIDVINAFEQSPANAASTSSNLSPMSSPKADLKTYQWQEPRVLTANESRNHIATRQGSVTGTVKAKPAVPPKPRPGKSDLENELNKELITMFRSTSISPATGKMKPPVSAGASRAKGTEVRSGYQVRYVKVHLIANFVPHDDTYRGKVTFTTYIVDNRRGSDDRAMGSQYLLNEEPESKNIQSDFEPKVTHAKGKVHVLCDDLFSKQLSQLKESLADYGLRIKCKLEQQYFFNLYDWRSDTHSIDGSSDRAHNESMVYEKILMYKKNLNPALDETDGWESGTDFLSKLII